MTKYYIPDEKGEPIEVTEEVFKAYDFILNELKKDQTKKKKGTTKKFKKLYPDKDEK